MTAFCSFSRSATTVSRLGFGGAAVGLKDYLGHYEAGALAQRAAAVAAIHQALEDGISYFDTAPGYGNGLSEQIFGEALQGRTDVCVATKVSVSASETVRASVETSLRRLRRDSIDLVQIHGTSYTPEILAQILAPGGTLEQLVQLRGEGVVRAIGFTSEDNNDAVFRLIETEAFDTMQIAYNLLLQHPFEPTRPFGSLLKAKQSGLFIVAMRGLTSGVFQRWVRLVNPADEFDYSAALLQFVLSNPLIDVALVGMRTPDEVARNAAVWRDETRRLDLHDLWTRYREGGKSV